MQTTGHLANALLSLGVQGLWFLFKNIPLEKKSSNEIKISSTMS